MHLDLTKRRYLLLKDAYGKAKNCTSVAFACADRYQLLALSLMVTGNFSIPWKNLRDHYWKFNK